MIIDNKYVFVFHFRYLVKLEIYRGGFHSSCAVLFFVFFSLIKENFLGIFSSFSKNASCAYKLILLSHQSMTILNVVRSLYCTRHNVSVRSIILY